MNSPSVAGKASTVSEALRDLKPELIADNKQHEEAMEAAQTSINALTSISRTNPSRREAFWLVAQFIRDNK